MFVYRGIGSFPPQEKTDKPPKKNTHVWESPSRYGYGNRYFYVRPRKPTSKGFHLRIVVLDDGRPVTTTDQKQATKDQVEKAARLLNFTPEEMLRLLGIIT